MPQTKKLTRGGTRHSPKDESNGIAPIGEVLSLGEAAAYLRVSEDGLLRMIEEQALPARQIDSEWRLLKSAIHRWLGRESGVDTSKAAQLAVIGSWKNDPHVDGELAEILRRRRAAASEDVS